MTIVHLDNADAVIREMDAATRELAKMADNVHKISPAVMQALLRDLAISIYTARETLVELYGY